MEWQKKKIIVANGHDVAASIHCEQNRWYGFVTEKHLTWLTPSGKILIENECYEMTAVLRFRTVKMKDNWVLLAPKVQYEITSEALSPKLSDTSGF